MPKVLIITYYWPPAGGSGVQRWLKFVKYFRDFGWEPVVFTAANPEAPAYDDSLLKDVPAGVEIIRSNVVEPYSIYRKVVGAKGTIGVGFTSAKPVKRSYLSDFAVWVRGNLFIPDARALWIRPAANQIAKYLKDNPVDAIISTGPPHTTHLIALRVKRKTGLPWLADFRDPWTSIDYYKDLKLTRFADRLHHRLERKVLATANATVVVSSQMLDEYRALSPRIELVENGFDADDYSHDSEPALDADFSICHVGSITPNRNCPALWKAISIYASQNAEFKQRLRIRLVGSVDQSVVESLNSLGLTNNVDLVGYLPHKQVAAIQLQSQILLLLVNNSPNAKGILTGKIFEYMAAKRPILAVGPKGGDIDNLLSETSAGILFDFDNTNEMLAGIAKLWTDYKGGWQHFNPSGADRYSRRNLTQRIANILNDIK